MRNFFSGAAILVLLCMAPIYGAPDGVAQIVAVHQAAPPTAATTPAKATASAIIPGSPLAALTGAGAPAASGSGVDSDTPSPFGTSNLGLSFSNTIGAAVARTVDDFVGDFQDSTRLTPVFVWARTVAVIPDRRAHAMAIAAGLAIVLGPAIVAEAAIRFALLRPRAALRVRAGRTLPAEPPPLTPPADADFTEPAEVEGIADAEAGETEKRPRHKFAPRAWFRRLMFALLDLGFALAPVAGFVLVVALSILLGLLTVRPARLAVIGVANAYLAYRLILVIARFVLAPKAAALRLIAMPDYHAAWLVHWIRLILASIAAGYAVISIAELLGLPHSGFLALLNLATLAVHIEVAVAIWQSRRVVGRWIAGPREPTSYMAGFRHRLASVWHFFALFYVLALWIAYAGGVHNAFGLLLRVILVFIAALIIGRLAWTGSTHLLDRLFPDPDTADTRHKTLYSRARAYNPLIRLLIRVVIGIAMLVIILQGWGVNAVGWLLTDAISRSLISAFVSIIITIAVALVIWEASNAWINGRIDHLTELGRTRRASRLRTLLPMLKASIGMVIFLVAGLICLSKIGVNAAPLLAGAGVVGIAVGFGSQKLVQDIITGLFLLLEDAMQVGDVITLAGMSGTVERLSIRTIRLRGGDGSVNIIPFSAVTTVTNQTRDFGYAQISIEVGYEEDLTRVYAVLTDIAKTMRAEPKWGLMMKDDLQIFGLDQFGASALVITGQIRTGPGQHWAVRREFYARVKQRFEAEHIEMPYTYLPPAPPRPDPPALDKPTGPAPDAP